MADLTNIVREYASMWPREVFDRTELVDGGKEVAVRRHLPILEKPGVYILYRDDVPYYIGRAKRLRSRLFQHARRPGSKYDLFWNYFSVFVVEDEQQRGQVEALLIAAIPTANGAKPRLQKHPYPRLIRLIMHEKRPVKSLSIKSNG